MSRPLRSSNTPLTKVAQADPYEAQWQGAPLSSQSLPRKHQEVDKRSFNSFDEFYACYLSELSHPVNRGLHVAGTVISILIAFFIVLRVFVIASSPPSFLLYLPLALLPDYGFAWIGHLLFERNKPATFAHPLLSLRGDLTLLFDIVSGNQSLVQSSATIRW